MNTECIVVGAGIVGLTTAIELRRNGISVTLLEQNIPGKEASWAGAGILFPLLPWDYPSPVTALTSAGTVLYPAFAKTLQDDTGVDPELVQSGVLLLPDFDLSKATSWCASHGIRMEIGNSWQYMPELDSDEKTLWLPEVYQVRNPRLLQALCKWLEINGVNIISHAPAEHFHIRANRITAISTPKGGFSANNVIITSGAWSKNLLGRHALGININPVAGQMLLLRSIPGQLKHILIKNGMYAVPRADGHILVGSTLEDTGFDKRTTSSAFEALYSYITNALPPIKSARLIKHWTGLRPGSPGNVPTISRHPTLENLYINSGHFRYGVTMAPASAALLADLMLGRPSLLDPTPYRWPTPA